MHSINLDSVNWIERYPADSLQIYFAGSLEIQQELTNVGYKVPSDKSKKIKTPVPLIYSNFRGWEITPEPITIERLIPPEWYGKTPSDLGWEETIHKGKRAYNLPQEEVYVDVGLDDKGLIYFKLEVEDYHLERTSIRQIGPEKWNNWVMFYINAEYLNDLMNIFENSFDNPLRIDVGNELRIVSEKQQGGKEKTYYVSTTNKGSLGIPVVYYSFCLGCFDLSLDYFRFKAKENGLDPSVVNELKLRIEYDKSINTGLKVGVAKIVGKQPQIMFKLASNTPIEIKGILKDRITGKARGKLTFCDHRSKLQIIVADAKLIYSALELTQPKLKSF